MAATLPLIYNPTAGGGSEHKARKAARTLTELGAVVEMLPTTGPGSAIRLAQTAAERGIPRVLVAGGDGTLNEVINGLAGSGTELAVIPTGTANVLSVELGNPFRVEQAARLAFEGQSTAVDLGCALLGKRCHYFVLMAGIGFDALVIKNINPVLKKSIRRAAYPVSGLLTFLQKDLPRLSVRSGGKEYQGYFVIASNSRYYGGKFGPNPDATMYDGLLDVCVLKGKKLQEMINFWVAALRMNTLDERLADYFRAGSLEISCASGEPVPLQTDGEVIGELPVELSVRPLALRIVTGRAS